MKIGCKVEVAYSATELLPKIFCDCGGWIGRENCDGKEN